MDHVTCSLVLRCRDYSESDKIVVFLTRDFGKISAIAKGAKRSKRRFVNVLEPFAHVRLLFRQPRNSSLGFVVACDAIELFKNLARDFRCYAYGSYVIELVDRVTTGREISRETYHLVRDALALVDRGKAASGLLRAFEVQLLRQTGYLPPLDSCCRCRRRLAGGAPVYFVAAKGGLTCRDCQPRGGGLIVSEATLKLLLELEQVELKELSSDRFGFSPAVGAEARMLLRGFFGPTVGGPLKSDKLLETVELAG